MQPEVITIDKLVHGGQALGTLANGRKAFVWNALPGEIVQIRITKKRRDYVEAVAEEIIEASTERIPAIDEAYLSTSPWQIMSWEAENKYKKEILQEAFSREKVVIPAPRFVTGDQQSHYRNKMEYSFWGDDDGLHLALFRRASHGKLIINGSSIARPEIDDIANKICSLLNEKNVRGSQLKTVVVRCNQAGECVAALFVKDENFPRLKGLEALAKGVAVYYSSPKSPASIISKELYTYGDLTLTDTILGREIIYDVNSFFQVNVPVFELALKQIQKYTKKATHIVDIYSGVGTIGIALGHTKTLVESDAHNVAMAQQNSAEQDIEIIHASAEQSLEYVNAGACIIVDPPRAGLHANLTHRILEVKPQQVVYLSCNPSTQARDLVLLQSDYKITLLEGYNFFPRTPHIESLAVLELKS